MSSGRWPTMFAATHPERTSRRRRVRGALELGWTAETPWEWTARALRGAGGWVASYAVPSCAAREDASAASRVPSLADDQRESSSSWWYRVSAAVSERRGYACGFPSSTCAPTSARSCRRSASPSLVLRRERLGIPEPSWEPSARYVADHIAGAQLRRATRVRHAVLDRRPGCESWRAVDEFLESMRLPDWPSSIACSRLSSSSTSCASCTETRGRARRLDRWRRAPGRAASRRSGALLAGTAAPRWTPARR